MIGDDPNKGQDDLITLHDQIVSRWRIILAKGLKKSESLALLGDYNPPKNLPTLTPPKLNPEVRAALPKQNITTDSSNIEVQNQLGRGLSALGTSLTLSLSQLNRLPENIRTDLLKGLSDAGKIFANLFHRVSVTRKNLIIPCLKNMKDLADSTEPSEFLFGGNLSDKLNTVKTLECVNKELKLPSTSKQPSSRGQNRGSQLKATSASRNLNSYYPTSRLGETGPYKGQTSRNYHKETYKKSQWNRQKDKIPKKY
ncbi:unnamed protein product [Acanthoscelides obtectus]|uniref:Uncharacterized protein n=1 Tax=Acanthoscelides obtectus TaxID=200917 RepID=A0A9P0PXZ4_ACAOB|nr:unnamed protein product [Acanthoscelides obtectus]CAH2011341.1 unnamed protein product [Acanthoscelides obtectus]CAK1680512.1 hypothetical protein AOBTE_LOCUS32714 [Acanthoscelides obtectus]CAK1689477.1 hypothetical protein AOBTE_LOCUS37287 [Acanthoscelides obtectus]